MENRRRINSNLARWIAQKVETDYPQDISLVCIYGSYINGTMNKMSDLDCYFIPKNEKSDSFARTFLIDGVGYDIFPMTWERLEAISRLEGGMQPLLGDVKILYAASREELSRFRELQSQLKQKLADPVYCRTAAIARCRQAAEFLASAAHSSPSYHKWMTAGQMLMVLAEGIALFHRDYYHQGLKNQYSTLCSQFPQVPDTIKSLYKSVVLADSPENALHQARLLLEAVCFHMQISCPQPSAPAPEDPAVPSRNIPLLTALYQEICSTFQKIYLACEKQDPVLAFLSAVNLQGDLEYAVTLDCPEYDLFTHFDSASLSDFSESIRTIEHSLVSFLLENGAHIHSYSSFEDFEIHNPL